MVYTTHKRNSILDLDSWIGLRQGTFRFELRDGVNGQFLGEIHPIKSANPTLTHDTSRTIKRQIQNIQFTPQESALIDPVRHRVHVFMEIAEQSYPLGRYVFIDDARTYGTAGTFLSTTLVDEMLIVDQELDTGFSPSVSHKIITAVESAEPMIRRLLFNFPFQIRAEASEFYSIGSWSQGTSRAKALEDIALDGDYFSPWFGNDYALHLVRAFDPAERVVNFDWDRTKSVIRDSIVEVNELLTAPNRFVVVSNRSTSASNTPVWGTYDIPVSAPNSITNRGFIIPKTFSLQVDTAPQAAVLAQNIGQRQTIFERVELSTPPDPRHDSYDVVYWNEESWLELSWSLPLVEGSEMRHVLRKVYT